MTEDGLRGSAWRTLILVPVLLASWVSPALAQRHVFQLPPQAIQVAPDTFDLGVAQDVDGRAVRGFAFIHPRRGFGHKPGHGGGGPGGGPGGGGGGGGSSDCFAFLANGAKWKNVEPYVLDPENSSGVPESDVAYWTGVGLIAWEAAAGPQIFGERDASVLVDGADTASPDGKNEVLFALIPDPGVIAATTVWYTIGPPFARQIVEWDMVLDDDGDFVWGDATVNPALMDFLNVFTHEAGHAAGLGHPSDACTEETMYRFTQEGETKKRTLNAGDEAGIKALY